MQLCTRVRSWAQVCGCKRRHLRDAGQPVADMKRLCWWRLSPAVLFTSQIDVGANMGMTAVFYAQKAGRSGRVHAFEPQALMVQVRPWC